MFLFNLEETLKSPERVLAATDDLVRADIVLLPSDRTMFLTRHEDQHKQISSTLTDNLEV